MKPPPRQMVVSFLGMFWIYPLPRMPVTNKGLYGLNVVFLVVTVTGWGYIEGMLIKVWKNLWTIFPTLRFASTSTNGNT